MHPADYGELTLREELRALLCSQPRTVDERPVTAEVAQFFRCHDTAHVIFGCDTSLFGEGVVKLFTIWGTTLGFRGHLAGYAEADAFDLFRQYSARHLSQQIGSLVRVLPEARRRARRMHAPWPWSEHEQWLDTPIAEIRDASGPGVRRPAEAPNRKAELGR